MSELFAILVKASTALVALSFIAFSQLSRTSAEFSASPSASSLLASNLSAALSSATKSFCSSNSV